MMTPRVPQISVVSFFPQAYVRKVVHLAKRAALAATLALMVAVILPLGVARLLHREQFVSLPDFTQYQDAQQRKRAFIQFIQPLVTQANESIRHQQTVLAEIYKLQRNGAEVPAYKVRWLKELAAKYDVEPVMLNAAATGEQRYFAWQLLFRRVDEVPVSLAVAQAANESAWGTSRFAREGRNLFGQWCYQQGCGMVPKNRDADKSHEVRVFKSPYESVVAYVHNLNTHQRYTGFRVQRADLRRKGEILNGEVLAAGLGAYSEKGDEYIEIIRSMIQKNGLQLLDGIQRTAEKDHSELSS